MINALHLLWIVPLVLIGGVVGGFILATLLTANDEDDDLEW